MNNLPVQKQIEEYMHYCQYVRHFTDDTIEDKQYVFRLFLRETKTKDMESFTNEHLNEWISYQLRGINRPRPVAASTVNKRVANIVSFVKYLKDTDYNVPLRLHLINHVKEVPPRRHYYTREQIERALDNADLMDRVMYQIKSDSGLRISELAKLKPSNFNGCTITVIGKGRKRADVYIRKVTHELLQKYLKERNIELDGWLWPSPHADCAGKHMSVDAIRQRGKRMFERVGINDFYPHSVRHSLATNLRFKKASLDVIQTIMRHTSLNTTQDYLHNLETGMLEEYRKYMEPDMTATI